MSNSQNINSQSGVPVVSSGFLFDGTNAVIGNNMQIKHEQLNNGPLSSPQLIPLRPPLSGGHDFPEPATLPGPQAINSQFMSSGQVNPSVVHGLNLAQPSSQSHNEPARPGVPTPMVGSQFQSNVSLQQQVMNSRPTLSGSMPSSASVPQQVTGPPRMPSVMGLPGISKAPFVSQGEQPSVLMQGNLPPSSERMMTSQIPARIVLSSQGMISSLGNIPSSSQGLMTSAIPHGTFPLSTPPMQQGIVPKFQTGVTQQLKLEQVPPTQKSSWNSSPFLTGQNLDGMEGQFIGTIPRSLGSQNQECHGDTVPLTTDNPQKTGTELCAGFQVPSASTQGSGLKPSVVNAALRFPPPPSSQSGIPSSQSSSFPPPPTAGIHQQRFPSVGVSSQRPGFPSPSTSANQPTGFSHIQKPGFLPPPTSKNWRPGLLAPQSSIDNQQLGFSLVQSSTSNHQPGIQPQPPSFIANQQPGISSAQFPTSNQQPGFQPQPSSFTAIQQPGFPPPPCSTTSQQPGFPPLPHATTSQQPGFSPPPHVTTSQQPGFPPPPHATISQQSGFLPPPHATTSQQPVYPQPPHATTSQQPGFPQPPHTTTSQQPGYPPPPHSTTRQQPGFPPPPHSTTSQQPGFYPLPHATTSQQPGFPPPPFTTINQQPVFPPPTHVTTSQQSGFPPPPHVTTSQQPGYPPPPHATTSQQPGFSPPPHVTTIQQPGFPPPPHSTTSQQPGFPPPPRSTTSQQPGFPPPPHSTGNQYQAFHPPTSTNQNSICPPPPYTLHQPCQPLSQRQQVVQPQYASSGMAGQGIENSKPTSQGANGMSSDFNNLSLQASQHINLLLQKQLIPPDGVKTSGPALYNEVNRNVNCSPDIFRCTLNEIPQTSALLNKSRIPLGILIHPFKDMSQLPVIQSSTIVRCCFCRAYINPFVTFVDSRRWKCNLCYKVNELPDEFSFDPVSKTYGDPQRRPEIKSATIEYIALSEYMFRPPQPAVYLYLIDVSFNAVETGYLTLFCETLVDVLNRIPGDSRTQMGFIAYDSAVHFFNLAEGLSQSQILTISDVDDVFLPCPDSLLVNLNESRQPVIDLLSHLPTMFANNVETRSALGAALQAAYKMIMSVGGRVTVLQTTLPTFGPGALQNREDAAQRTSKDISSLGPATDFYKKLALDFSAQQIAVDLFMLNGQYADLASLECICKYSGGCVYYYPSYHAIRTPHLVEKFEIDLRRYLTRKIGFESVMRLRCSKGLSIHTFHGNFFVRSTDLLSLPNVNPDSALGMQMSIDEALTDKSSMCFQAALLYTSSKGERRIRVHTLCLPVTNQLSKIHAAADQQAIVALLAKMAVDRSITTSLSDAREAIVTAAIDTLNAYGSTLTASQRMGGLVINDQLRLIPLYCLALLKSIAFRTGVSTKLDDRVYALHLMKTLPTCRLIQMLYPDMYPVHTIMNMEVVRKGAVKYPKLPLLQLSSANIDRPGAYLLDTGDTMYIYIGSAISEKFCKNIFGVPDFASIQEGGIIDLPELDNECSQRLRNFLEYLLDNRPNGSTLVIVREDGKLRMEFFQHFVEDQTEFSMSYHEFLQHIQKDIKF